jgi:hypothetical protein
MQGENLKEDMRRQFITIIDDMEKLKQSQVRLQVFLDSLLTSSIPAPTH